MFEPFVGWKLILRDVTSDLFNNPTIINSNTSQPDNFSRNFSLMGDFHDGLFADSDYKSGGSYLFKWILYSSVNDARQLPEGTPTNYIQWKQTYNPTLFTNAQGGSTELTLVGPKTSNTYGGDHYFKSMGLYSSGTNVWMKAMAGNNYYYCCGLNTNITIAIPNGTPWCEKGEMWIWQGPKP